LRVFLERQERPAPRDPGGFRGPTSGVGEGRRSRRGFVANRERTGRAIAHDSATLADAQKAVGSAWAASDDDGLKRVHVAVGLGLNGGSWEHEKIKKLENENAVMKKENTQIRKVNSEIKKETAGIIQANTLIKLENTQIKERLNQIGKAMAKDK
jgi:hypothetical protein